MTISIQVKHNSPSIKHTRLVVKRGETLVAHVKPGEVVDAHIWVRDGELSISEAFAFTVNGDKELLSATSYQLPSDIMSMMGVTETQHWMLTDANGVELPLETPVPVNNGQSYKLIRKLHETL